MMTMVIGNVKRSVAITPTIPPNIAAVWYHLFSEPCCIIIKKETNTKKLKKLREPFGGETRHLSECSWFFE